MAALAACFALAMVGGAALAPQAGASFSECEQGWVCLWQNELFTGRKLQFQDWGTWQNLTAYEFNDQASSVYNHTNRDAKISWDINGGGATRCIQPSESFQVMPGNWNNSASAIHTYQTASVC